MRLKIRGGTVDHGEPSLCYSCRSATVVKGSKLRDEIVTCSVVHARVTFAVHQCTDYVNHNHASVYQMEEIAWILRCDPKRNHMGFVPASKLRPATRHVLDDLD